MPPAFISPPASTNSGNAIRTNRPRPDIIVCGRVIAQAPEIILFGTGWNTVLPPRDVVFDLARKGIGFETMDTPAACRTFNILVSEDRDVAAVLLID